MARILSLIVATALVVITTACSTTHMARTIGEGNAAVVASLGGPVVELFGKPIPVPLSTLGGVYGIRDDLDVHGHLHPTMLAYDTFGADAGVTWQALDQRGGIPALAAGASLLFITDLSPTEANTDPGCATCVLPDLHLTASWLVGRHLVYGGVRSLVQTTPDLATGLPRAILAPLVGGELRVAKRLGLVGELRLAAPFRQTNTLAPHYYGPAGYGAVSFLLGLNIHLDGEAP